MGVLISIVSLITTTVQLRMAFVCDICGKSFLTSEKLRFHKVCHGQDENKCHICDKICTGKKAFNNHIKSHQTYECPDCGKTIKMNSISHHKSKCSPKEKKSFACSECPYEVDRQDRLKPEYGLPLCHHLD